MPATREIKRRIASIGNTKKITKAMELVSAAKMRKAVERVQVSKKYAETAWFIAKRLSEKSSVAHVLAEKREIKRAAIIVISGNKGLCGSFNRDVIHRALLTEKKLKRADTELDFITCGKKAGHTLASRKKNIAADFKKEDLTTSVEEIHALKTMIITDFINKKYDQVHMVYTDFESSLMQVPRSLQLLPITGIPDTHLGAVAEPVNETLIKNMSGVDYIFEPHAEAVLSELYPRLLAIQLYQGFLESSACEHSSRMVAMKNANEAAGEMLDALTLLYNRARQAGITQEIAEISAGRLALG